MSLIEFSKIQSEGESTEALRKFTEQELQKSNKSVSDLMLSWKNSVNQSNSKRDMLEQYCDRIDFDLSSVKNYFD